MLVLTQIRVSSRELDQQNNQPSHRIPQLKLRYNFTFFHNN